MATEGLSLDKKYNQYKRIYPKWAIDAMEAVLKTPSGPERWRKSAAIWYNLNPIDPESGLRAQTEYAAVVEGLHSKRASLKTRFGEIDNVKPGYHGIKSSSGVREQIEIPAGMWSYIKMFDKMAFDSSNPDAKKNLNKLRLEFEELSVARDF